MNNARIGDPCSGICYSHPNPVPWTGIVISGAATVLVNGMPSSIVTSIVAGSCGHTFTVISGSPTVFAMGMPKGRAVIDLIGPGSGTGTGQIILGSPNVFTN